MGLNAGGDADGDGDTWRRLPRVATKSRHGAAFAAPSAGISIAAVPEPASISLLLICGVFLADSALTNERRSSIGFGKPPSRVSLKK